MSETLKPRDERFAKIFADLTGIHNSQEGWPTGDAQMALRQIHGELDRWRSVAEQAEKALRDVMPDWFDEKLDKDKPDGNAAMEISYGNVRAIVAALAAFDSLRKEQL